MGPGKPDRERGFALRPNDPRRPADERQVVGKVRIAAPPQPVWGVLTEENAMRRRIAFD